MGADIRVGVIVCVVTGFVVSGWVSADDWAGYRYDNARSGSTSEETGGEFSPVWVYSSAYAPRTAWSGPSSRPREGFLLRHRVSFDDSFQVAAMGERVYFGSSVDDKIYALDAASGAECWSFFTGGPVRLAPTVRDGKVYAGSDDGYVYCLDAGSGELVWKVRGGVNDERLLGSGRMISRWPIRTGVLVEDGAAYFGAGIFPHENVYLYAVEAASGKLIWRNDTISQVQAYRNAFTPQGYMLASGDKLFVPCGRALPGAFDKATGRMLFQPEIGWRSEESGGVIGGTYALLADEQVYTGSQDHLVTLDQKTGRSGFGWFPGRRLAIAGRQAYLATGSEIVAMDRTAYAEASRKRKSLESGVRSLSASVKAASGDRRKQFSADLKAAQEALNEHNDKEIKPTIIWRAASGCDAELIVTGDMVIAGGLNNVLCLNRTTGAVAWRHEVAGTASGLAVAWGRLYVSTDKGKIYCFAGKGAQKGDGARGPEVVKAGADPYPADGLSEMYARAAECIVNESGVRRGYCLVIGAERGRLAYELARRTELQVIGVEEDMEKVRQGRLALDKAGLYGERVVLDCRRLSELAYSDYFANLVVSDSLLLTGRIPGEGAKIARHVKPCGGKVCLGMVSERPEGIELISRNGLEEWMRGMELGMSLDVSNVNGRWGVLSRGALAGAGRWTHQYADAGNTACGDDEIVGGALGLLWFGDPGPAPMVNRHNAAASPLAVNGRMFIQGENNVMAYDSYNGTLLWKRDIAGAMRDMLKAYECSNLAADEKSFFVGVGQECLRLDAESGKTIATYKVQGPQEAKWGYTACVGGVLYGSALSRRGASDEVFAYDVERGTLLWRYGGKNIVNLTIAVGDGWMFFVDSSLSPAEREAFLGQDKARFAGLEGKAAQEAEKAIKAMDVRMAVGLDARTGGRLWSRAVDVTDCSGIGIGGGELSAMYRDGVVLLCGANANGHYWRQFLRGEFKERRLVALSAKKGDVLWAADADYRHRPVIIGDAVLAEPWKFELKTGRSITRVHPVTGEEVRWQFLRPGHHCGAISACSDMLFMRSGFTSYYDLQDDSGIRHFAGHRLGCWINAIPADGLALVPEASAGCVCLFPIVCTVVLEPRADHERWGIYSSGGSSTPVKHLAINLGAPGDRRDADGTLWIGYPRPIVSSDRSAMGYSLEVGVEFMNGGRYVNRSLDAEPVAGTDKAWVFASAAEGVGKCTVPLLGEGNGKGVFSVRLFFADREGTQAGQRVFGIRLQGKSAAEGVDIAQECAGARRAVVRQFDNVEAERNLEIELVPVKGEPVLCGVEVIRNEGGLQKVAAN